MWISGIMRLKRCGLAIIAESARSGRACCDDGSAALRAPGGVGEAAVTEDRRWALVKDLDGGGIAAGPRGLRRLLRAERGRRDEEPIAPVPEDLAELPA